MIRGAVRVTILGSLLAVATPAVRAAPQSHPAAGSWKVYLSEQTGARAALAGPQDVQSGYSVQSSDGLLEIESPQTESAAAGYVYTAAPLPETYDVAFHYTLLNGPLGREDGHRILSVSADDLAGNLANPFQARRRWSIRIRRDMGTFIGYRDADGEMRWWDGQAWGDSKTRLFNCTIGDTVTFRFAKDAAGLCRLSMTNGKQTVSPTPVAADWTQLGQAAEAFVVGDSNPGWNGGDAHFLFSSSPDVAIESLGDQSQGVNPDGQMKLTVVDGAADGRNLKAMLEIYEGHRLDAGRANQPSYFAPGNLVEPTRRTEVTFVAGAGGRREVTIDYAAPRYERWRGLYPTGWMVVRIFDSDLDRELYRSTSFRAGRFRLGSKFTDRKKSLEELGVRKPDRPAETLRQELLRKAAEIVAEADKSFLTQTLAAVKRWNAAAKTLLRVYEGYSDFLDDSEQPDHSQAVEANIDRLLSAETEYVCWRTPNITGNGEVVLPWTDPALTPGSEMLRITACRGEYEPAGFAVTAYKRLSGVRVRVSELKGRDRTIPASAVDIKLVKCWYQAGLQERPGLPLLTPELLLNDDRLVRVDHVGRMNILGDLRQRRDAPQLLPVDVPAGLTRQFWVTVHVPADAEPGRYTGAITVSPANAAPRRLALDLTVLPFDLQGPDMLYSIYYYDQPNDGEPTTSYLGKTATQIEADLRNMKAHGIMSPECRRGFDREKMAELFEIRRRVGLDMETLLYSGIGVGYYNPTQERLETLKTELTEFMDFARQWGFKDIYFYGADERQGEELEAQRPAWQAAHEVGAKVWVSCGPDYWGFVGDLLDIANLWWTDTAVHADEMHEIGHRVLRYMNPMCGLEQPDLYRQNYGLHLWKGGWDGTCNFAFQVDFGIGGWRNDAGWDDFNLDPHQCWKDHNMTYASLDGPIDTIQWEGFREGVDDVRYLRTLQARIGRAKSIGSPDLAAMGRAAETWINSIPIQSKPRILSPGATPPHDLDGLRQEMIRRILELR